MIYPPLLSEHDAPAIPGLQFPHVHPTHLLEPVLGVKRLHAPQPNQVRGAASLIHQLETFLDERPAQPLALVDGVNSQRGQVPGLSAARSREELRLGGTHGTVEAVNGLRVNGRAQDQSLEAQVHPDERREPRIYTPPTSRPLSAPIKTPTTKRKKHVHGDTHVSQKDN